MKKILILFVFTLTNFLLFAQTPLLSVDLNDDGTIHIEAGFANGASAAGGKLYLKDKETDEILWEGVFPENSSIDIAVPTVPYTVNFDGGFGKIITKDGIEQPESYADLDESGTFDTDDSEESFDSNDESFEEESVEIPEEQEEEPELIVERYAAWNPIDTMNTVPKMGPSFIAVFAFVLALIDFILIIVLLRKKK